MAKSYFSYGINLNASNRDLVTSTVKYENQTKRYFSSIDAEIYMGGVRILDINRIDFSYQENKMPIYGFNSFIPSRVIVGQKLIQGTFIINFTKPGYIAELLNSNMRESEIAGKYDKVGKSCDINNAPLFKKSFDILLGYGGHNIENETSYNSCYQILQGVYITGFYQILDVSGEPIYEVYTFIARDFSFNGIDKIYKSEASTSNESSQDLSQPSQPQEPVKPNDNNNIEKPDNKVDKIEELAFKSKLLYSKANNASSKIHVAFNKDIKDSINSVKVIISDNVINMSKSYSLKNTGIEWTVSLNASDTNSISKRIPKINSTMNCYLEIKYKTDKDMSITKTKSVKLYRAT